MSASDPLRPPASTPASASRASVTHESRQRVRYSEVDRMGYLWHGHYLVLFEEARADWLRARGLSYRELEDAGMLLVVVETGVSYLKPGGYEDELVIRCTPVEATGARLRMEYEVLRQAQRLATGFTVLACVDRRGRPQRLPDELRALVEPPAAGEGTGTGADPKAVQGPARESLR